jgi:hypothetical protein
VETSLLISKTTRDALERPTELRAFPLQKIKGVDELIEVFTPAS